MTETAERTPRTGGWCSQHRQPRAECDPADRHVQSFRASDELMDAVAAKAATMGLSRNDGIEMALEILVGWHEAGQPWKGPSQWTRTQRATTLATGALNLSEHQAARRVLEARDAEIRQQREREQAERDQRKADREQARAARKQRAAEVGARTAARKARDAQIVTAALAGADHASLAAEHGLTRERVRQIVGSARTAAPPPGPGSAVFLEPGGKHVIAAAVPEVPASRNRKGRRP